MKYDVGVVIGRFQPFHNGHLHLIEEARKHCQLVVVVVGSANQPPNIRNPFSFIERKQMITAGLELSGHAHRDGVSIVAQDDHPYNHNRWYAGVSRHVGTVVNSVMGWSDKPRTFALFGHEKDHTSFYLKGFPQWRYVSVKPVKVMNATDIRDKVLANTPFWEMEAQQAMPGGSVVRLLHLADGDKLNALREEYAINQAYKKSWETAPFPPTFHTVDALVVIQSHILLVKRKTAPGRGLLALPGGFVNVTETLQNAAIRELREETRIKVPDAVLHGSIKSVRTFDDPNRSSRGRTITTAYLITPTGDYLEGSLPRVRGSDDAEKALWVPLSDVRRDNMFEDHFDIIEYMVGI